MTRKQLKLTRIGTLFHSHRQELQKKNPATNKGWTEQEIYLISLTWRPGGRDCFSLSAFSMSVIFRVYKNLEQRTLNLTLSLFFFILTPLASFLRARSRNCLISLISLGILASLSEVNQANLSLVSLDLPWRPSC